MTVDIPEYDGTKPVPKLEYTSAGAGFLLQDDPHTDPKTFKYLERDFGLALGSWAEFQSEFQKLVESQDENTRFKVLFLARHGQGYHNLCIDLYGEPYWDKVLCFDYGNDEMTWGPDPELTALGVTQAKANNVGWKQQISKGVPLPTVFYTSPFTRSIDTMVYTWHDVLLDKSHIAPPLVLEDLREDIGEHTCDKRNPRSYIENRFPQLKIEPGLTEQDELYSETWRETLEEHNVRTKHFLDHLFELDWSAQSPHLYVSVTSHSGTINSFLSSINHRKFSITPGGMIPVIVKATRS